MSRVDTALGVVKHDSGRTENRAYRFEMTMFPEKVVTSRTALPSP
jgi:hypothetical protein